MDSIKNLMKSFDAAAARELANTTSNTVDVSSKPLAAGMGGMRGGMSFHGGGGGIGRGRGMVTMPLPAVRAPSIIGRGGIAGPRAGTSLRNLRAVTIPRPVARLPQGYRLGRSMGTAPAGWAMRSRGLAAHPIGSGHGHIFRPISRFYRPWGSYPGFFHGIGMLRPWLVYPWFSLWYAAYLVNSADPWYDNRYYTVADTNVSAFPELGYVDLREWTPEEVDEHVRQLETVYATTVSEGYRIVVDPSTGRLRWVTNVHLPSEEIFASMNARRA